MRAGGIGLCVATQIAGCMKPRGPCATWNSPEQAWAMTQAQLAWYRAMEDAGELKQIATLAEFETHVGIGSDLDGGFGTEQSPQDLETIADLEKVAELLRRRGFNARDVEGVMSGNFVRFVREAWR